MQNNYQCAKHSHKNAEFNLPSLRSKMFPVPFRLYSDTCHGKESVWEVISSPPFVKCKRLVCQKQHEMSHYIPGAFEHNSFCCRVWLWLVSRLEKDGEVHPPKLVWGFCKHQRFLLTSMLEYAGQSGISFLKNKEEANSDWATLRLIGCNFLVLSLNWTWFITISNLHVICVCKIPLAVTSRSDNS